MHAPHIHPEVVARAVERRGGVHVFDRIDPARTAHIVVDLQNGFMAPGEVAEIAAAREIVPNVNRLSAALRRGGGTVAYIQNTFDEEAVRSWGVFFDHFCSPQRRERMVAAFTPGAFGHALWDGLDDLRRPATVTGIPNNGGEGFRFLGYPAYDGLVNWDFVHVNQTAEVAPGLFTAWTADEKNPNRWLFTVRQGVRFHDGSDFNADAVVWNLQRIYDDKSPQHDAPAAPIVRATVSMVESWEKADGGTVVISTKYPFSFLPCLLARILVARPAQWDKLGRSWQSFAKAPSGTGPFRITRVAAGQRCEMSRNDEYWDKARIPKLDKMTVYPMPEATTRLAALRSGQVGWIEVPPPDAIPSLKQAGFDISLWPYPHTCPYVFNCLPGTPFADTRVRQAANYAIDRDGLCSLLNGTGKPAMGLYPPENPVFGDPKNRYAHDPGKARVLLEEAGYGGDKRVRAKIMISASGSGQMVPIPMNEFLQQNLQEVGIDIDFDVVEWGTMLVAVRSAPTAAPSHGVDGVNISLSYTDPSSMFRCYGTESWSPTNYNWGHWSSRQADDLLKQAQQTFDPAAQAKLLAQAHAIVVDKAPWLFIVHDLNPRAMSKKMKSLQPAQSRYQDFT